MVRRSLQTKTSQGHMRKSSTDGQREGGEELRTGGELRKTNADCAVGNKHVALSRKEAGFKSPTGLSSDLD